MPTRANTIRGAISQERRGVERARSVGGKAKALGRERNNNAQIAVLNPRGGSRAQGPQAAFGAAVAAARKQVGAGLDRVRGGTRAYPRATIDRGPNDVQQIGTAVSRGRAGARLGAGRPAQAQSIGPAGRPPRSIDPGFTRWRERPQFRPEPFGPPGRVAGGRMRVPKGGRVQGGRRPLPSRPVRGLPGARYL